MDLSKLEGVQGCNLQELELRKGIMPPLKREKEEEPEDHSGSIVNEEGQLGPTDQFGMPVKFAYRRAFSHMELLESVGKDFTFQNGWCYNFITRGDVDMLSYLTLILREQDIEHLILSSWRAERKDMEMILHWKEKGRIGKIEIYLGRLYAHSHDDRYNIRQWRELCAPFPDVTIKVFRNHTKIAAGKGAKFNFVVQSSANMNTNVNAENACIIIDDEAFEFYRQFFSEVKTLI